MYKIRGEITMKVMISTVYKGVAVPKAIHLLSPEKVILLDADETDNKRNEERKKGITLIKDKFGDFVKISVIKTSLYDLVKITKDVAKIIDDESEKGNEVYVNITESRKTQSIGTMYGAYVRKDKVRGIYYITEEEQRLISLPVIDIKLKGTKEKLIVLIESGMTKAKDLAEKLDVHISLIYANFKEMQKEGLLDDNLQVTEAGRLRVV